MSNKGLNLTERKILLELARSARQTPNDELPRTGDLARKLAIVDGAVSNAKRKLKELGLLDQHGYPTDSAFEHLRLRREVIPSMVPFLGKVKAGKSKYGEVRIDMRDIQDLNDPDIPTFALPPVDRDSKIIALEVEGVSMEAERIFAGDFVLVELFQEDETPKQGELIVTRYITKNTDHDPILEKDIEDESFEGPTLKHYYKEETYIRLSMQRNHGGNEHTIKASQIRPVGRVIGVYRPFSN